MDRPDQVHRRFQVVPEGRAGLVDLVLLVVQVRQVQSARLGHLHLVLLGVLEVLVLQRVRVVLSDRVRQAVHRLLARRVLLVRQVPLEVLLGQAVQVVLAGTACMGAASRARKAGWAACLGFLGGQELRASLVYRVYLEDQVVRVDQEGNRPRIHLGTLTRH